jgi:hypothetical protein
MKRVKIEKKEKYDEYNVYNNKEQWLGTIAKKKKNGLWWFFPEGGIISRDIWFSADCLKQISEFMQSLKSDAS